MAETRTNEQIIRDIVAEQVASGNSGDVTANASPELISQFNGGMEIIRDFSPITPASTDSLYLPNNLNNFDIYTYNIQLHQVNPGDVKLLETAITDGRTVLIADNSQESRYNISNMEQVFSLGQSLVRSTYAHNFTIEILEPNGATFLNNLVASALTNLNCFNANTARYFLVIEFIGRSPNGASVRYPTKFLYPIFIKNIEMQVTGDGSRYSITAVSESTAAYQYLEHTVKGSITVEARTVGEFVSEFLRKFNIMMLRESNLNPNQAEPDIYELTFDEETGTNQWLNWPIQQADEGLRTLGPSAIGDKIHFNIPNGSTITEILGIVLQSTAEYKNIQTHTNGTMKQRPGESAQADLNELPVFHKVITNIEYTRFDPLRKDWSKIVRFKVKKHIVADVVMDAAQYDRGITDNNIQNRRISAIFDEGLLRKKYDYIFTGLNTEVLNFDIKFNRAYYVMSVINKGSTGDPNTVASTAGQNQQTSEGSLAAITEVANRLFALTEERSRLVRDNNNIEPSSGDAAERLEQIDQELSDLRQQQDENLIAFNERRGTRLENPRSFDSLSGDFIDTESAQNEIVQSLRFAGDVVDDSDVYGPESDLEGGTIQFGTIKANLENTSDLMTIEINIKGDPYWLGMPNSFERKTNSEANEELADYELGGPMFFLNMHLPIDENEAGRRVPRNDYRISGLYRVLNVISNFEGGKFTMYLKARRDTLTNTPTVLNRLLNATTSSGNTSIASSNSRGNDVAQVQENGS